MKVFLHALRYLLPYWRWQVAALLSALVVTASTFIWPYTSMYLLDDVLIPTRPVPHRERVLVVIALASLACIVVGEAFKLVRAYLFARVGEGAAADLRRDLFRHLHRLPMTYFDRRKTGGIMSVLQADVEAVQVLYSSLLIEMVSNFLQVIVSIAILVAHQPRLTLVGLPIPIAFGVSLALFGRPLRTAGRRVREEVAGVQEIAQESVSGAREVKSFRREGSELARFLVQVRKLVRVRIHLSMLHAANWSVTDLVAWGGMTGMIVLGSRLVIRGEMTAGAMILFVNVLAMLFGPAGAFVNMYSQVASAVGAADRVFEFVDERPEPEVAGAAPLPAVQGRVQFERVGFHYEEGGPRVLCDIDLDAAPGETVALVGPSGAGKTTLVSLLPRLYDVTSGRVLVDGVDVREVTLASLRSCIAIVPQEPFLFGTTVRENIAFGREGAAEADIVAAAQAANAHDFITALPEGYDTQVGERGARLSVGQKQRLAIARAILRDPRILVLDEATSAQDSESERLVQEAMGRLMEGRTSFVIAHRLSTVLSADRIVVLEEGRVTQTGSHAELLAMGGTYARLHALQFNVALEVEDGTA